MCHRGKGAREDYTAKFVGVEGLRYMEGTVVERVCFVEATFCKQRMEMLLSRLLVDD